MTKMITMGVAELLRKLARYPPHKEVFISTPVGAREPGETGLATHYDDTSRCLCLANTVRLMQLYGTSFRLVSFPIDHQPFLIKTALIGEQSENPVKTVGQLRMPLSTTRALRIYLDVDGVVHDLKDVLEGTHVAPTEDMIYTAVEAAEVTEDTGLECTTLQQSVVLLRAEPHLD